MRNTTPDQSDVESARAGNREALGRLFDRHARGVRAVVVAVSQDWNAVEDLTQETFLRAYQRLPHLQQATKFRSWVQGIARRVAWEHAKHAKRRREQPGDIDVGDQRDPSHELAEREAHAQLHQALATLPERDRLAIHAFYFHGQQATEAANALDMSRSNFYVVLNRALTSLRRRLQPPAAKRENT